MLGTTPQQRGEAVTVPPLHPLRSPRDQHSLRARACALQATPLSQMPTLEEGMRVKGRYLASSKGAAHKVWYAGIVTDVHENGTYDISYDDGDDEMYVQRRFVRLEDEPTEDSDADSDSDAEPAVKQDVRSRRPMNYREEALPMDVDGSDADDVAPLRNRRPARAAATKKKKVVASSDDDDEAYEENDASEAEESDEEDESDDDHDFSSKRKKVARKEKPKAATKKAVPSKGAATSKATAAALAKKPTSTVKDTTSRRSSEGQSPMPQDIEPTEADAAKAPAVARLSKGKVTGLESASWQGRPEHKMKWTDEQIEELPVLTQPSAMFADLVHVVEDRAKLKGGSLEGHSLKVRAPCCIHCPLSAAADSPRPQSCHSTCTHVHVAVRCKFWHGCGVRLFMCLVADLASWPNVAASVPSPPFPLLPCCAQNSPLPLPWCVPPMQSLAQELGGRPIRVATMCSGTESPLLALDLICQVTRRESACVCDARAVGGEQVGLRRGASQGCVSRGGWWPCLHSHV